MMSPEMAKLWVVLHDETVEVHAQWNTFEDLFMGSQGQLDLMNRSAAVFFMVVQNSLARNIQLTICKLADPAGQSKKQNASAEQLLEQALGTSRGLEPTPQPLCEKYITASEPLRPVRNKVIAHFDLHTATGFVQPPAEMTIGEVRAALEALAGFMNAVGRHFGEAQTNYGAFARHNQGSSALLARLRIAEGQTTPWIAGKKPGE